MFLAAPPSKQKSKFPLRSPGAGFSRWLGGCRDREQDSCYFALINAAFELFFEVQNSHPPPTVLLDVRDAPDVNLPRSTEQRRQSRSPLRTHKAHFRLKSRRRSRPIMMPPPMRAMAICGSKKRTKRAPASVISTTPAGVACTIPPPPPPPPSLWGADESGRICPPPPPPAPRR